MPRRHGADGRPAAGVSAFRTDHDEPAGARVVGRATDRGPPLATCRTGQHRPLTTPSRLVMLMWQPNWERSHTRETAAEPTRAAHIGGARTVKRLTLREIGRLTGLSRSATVRVVNDHPEASPEVKRRALATIEETGRRPNRAARSLVSTRTGALWPGEPEPGGGRLPGSALRAPHPLRHQRGRSSPAHALLVPERGPAWGARPLSARHRQRDTGRRHRDGA